MVDKPVVVDYGPTPLKPISPLAFGAIFLLGGVFVSTVISVCLGAVMALMAFAIAAAYGAMASNGLASYGWILAVLTAALWLPLCVKVYSTYVDKFSQLGGERRFASAVLLTIASLPMLLLVILTSLAHNATTAGSVIWIGLAFGIAAQVGSCAKIYKARFAPLSSLARLPAAKVREETQTLLLEAQKVNNRADLNRISIQALANLGLDKIKLRSSKSAPIEVLIEVLVNQGQADAADKISENYLTIVERESAS